MSAVPYPAIPHSRSSSFVPRPSYAYTALTSGKLRGRCISAQTVYDVRLIHTARDTATLDALEDHYRQHEADYVEYPFAGHSFLLRYQTPPTPRMVVPGLYDITTTLIGHRVSVIDDYDITLAELEADLLSLWHGQEGPTDGSDPTDGAPPAAHAVAAWPLPYSQESSIQPRPSWLFDTMTDGQLIGRDDTTREVLDIALVHPRITQRQLDSLLYHYQQHQRDVIRLAYAGEVYDAHYLGEPEFQSAGGPWRTATVRLIGTRVASALAADAMAAATAALIDGIWPYVTRLLTTGGEALVDADGRVLTTTQREKA